MPILLRLGFSTVVNYHGSREFGRDLILTDQDRFGHVIFAAVQTKYVPSVGLGASGIESLISNVKHAFSSLFAHPQIGRQTHISGPSMPVKGMTQPTPIDDSAKWMAEKVKGGFRFTPS